MDQSDLKAHNVLITPTEEDTGNELSKTFYRSCSFCEKMVKVSSCNFKSCLNLGGNRFLCPFCLRHNFHHKSSRHVLILSFRSIIARYYHKHYLNSTGTDKLWINQIRQFINEHENVGLQNPVFCYDPETYLWFVDFTRVGKDSYKAPCSEVLETTRMILCCFRLGAVYSNVTFQAMWKKYNQSIELFYTQRKRPEDRRMLIPTLHNCGTYAKKEIREFFPHMLELK